MYFFNPSLKECKEFKDTYVEVAERLYGIIKVGAIDCQSEEELCEEFGAYDIPQISIFQENYSDDGERFHDELKVEKIMNAASKKMKNFVQVVSDDNYDNFVQRERLTKNKVLLFTDKKSTPTLFKALSKKYLDRLNLGEVKQTSTDLISKFKVSQFPTIIALTNPEDYEGEKYEGDMKVDQLTKFMSSYAYSTPKKPEITDFSELTEKRYKSNELCGAKSANICVIVFVSSADSKASQTEHLKSVI